jgi:hypothetical protein
MLVINGAPITGRQHRPVSPSPRGCAWGGYLAQMFHVKQFDQSARNCRDAHKPRVGSSTDFVDLQAQKVVRRSALDDGGRATEPFADPGTQPGRV